MTWMMKNHGKKNICFSYINRQILFAYRLIKFLYRLSHKLKFDANDPVLAKDANKKDDDWYEVYDPRNPLNKRRRGEDAKKSRK